MKEPLKKSTVLTYANFLYYIGLRDTVCGESLKKVMGVIILSDGKIGGCSWEDARGSLDHFGVS